ncbi:hypothetical protein EVA_10853 [gut metagenome]|uniref:Uncharacterized protein n=1 Tax=gut metagenome TaxID=749906 RepID=J9CLT6_9ZZZZ
MLRYFCHFASDNRGTFAVKRNLHTIRRDNNRSFWLLNRNYVSNILSARNNRRRN